MPRMTRESIIVLVEALSVACIIDLSVFESASAIVTTDFPLSRRLLSHASFTTRSSG
jgi:hypothetical protein